MPRHDRAGTDAASGGYPDFQGAGPGGVEQRFLSDIAQQELARWVKGISAHLKRIGMNNDHFAAREDIAGTMDALRAKPPGMPHVPDRRDNQISGKACAARPHPFNWIKRSSSASTSSIAKGWASFMPSSSSQPIGTATGAPVRARAE